MRFSELSDKEKIQSVKDSLIRLLEKLSFLPADERSKLIQQYLQITPPSYLVAALEKAGDGISEEEKIQMERRNQEVANKVQEKNKSMEEVYNQKLDAAKKLENLISGLKKLEGCVCGACFNVDIINGILPIELECLLPVARQTAEETAY